MDPRMMLRLRRLSIIPRWATVPTIHGQSVAEHSFHVAWIAGWLGGHSKSNTFDLARLLWAAIIHDDPEAVSGDIASPYKKDPAISKAIKAHEELMGYGLWGVEGLTPQEKVILKVADLLEALLFIHEERHIGNSTLGGVYMDVMEKLPPVWDLFEWASDAKPKKPSARDLTTYFLSHLNPIIHPGITDG